MTEILQAQLPLIDDAGVVIASLALHVPPGPQRERTETLRICTPAEDREGLETIQLIEGGEYRYSLTLLGALEGKVVALEPREVIFPDDRTGLSGRIRPGLYTGRLSFRVFDGVGFIAEGAVEVRSCKLNYLNEYRWMLDDVARVACELSLQRFAASEQRMKLDDEHDAATLYQRFCFLRSIIMGGRTEAALATITARPFVDWKETNEYVAAARGVRGTSQLARQLSRASRTQPWQDAWHPALTELPAELSSTRFDPSLDNIPNRFVRFVLEEWRARVAEVGAKLRDEHDRCILKKARVPAPVIRGMAEVNDLEQRLDTMLHTRPLSDVGRLSHFPGASQVLQRRAGYREFRELYALSEFAGMIDWKGGDDVFGAGQRNVATLYEYWVFLQLASIVSDLSGGAVRLDNLIKAQRHGLGLGLKNGEASILKGTIDRPGTTMNLELSFNREFRPNVSGGSWTRTMRPDCSLRISPANEDPLIEPLSLHFDAKYRVGSIEEVMGAEANELGAHPDDLLKMHTYRDAILRAVGAYVIYPGEQEDVDRKFGEIIPGLGAFPLTPGPDGVAEGALRIRAFLDEVIDHVCARGSQRARAGFWHTESYKGQSSDQLGTRPGWLSRPPADTTVLLGFVKSEPHLEWIRRTGLYNLRAGDRSGAVPLGSAALRADAVLLYGPPLGTRVAAYRVSTEPRVMTAENLLEIGYPSPGGSVYFCLAIAEEPVPEGLDVRVVRSIISADGSHVEGAPYTTTYVALMTRIGSQLGVNKKPAP